MRFTLTALALLAGSTAGLANDIVFTVGRFIDPERLLVKHQSRSLYVPVSVSEIVRLEPSDATIFIWYGEARMISVWTLDAHEVVAHESISECDLFAICPTEAFGCCDARQPLRRG